MEPTSQQSIKFKPAGAWKPPGGQSIALPSEADPATNAHRKPEGEPSYFEVEGMTCGNCARHVQDAASGVAGVEAAEARAEAGSLNVWWKQGMEPLPSKVAEAVSKAGYPARWKAKVKLAVSAGQTVSIERGAKSAREHGWSISLWVSMAAAVPLMVGEWILGWHHHAWYPGLSLILATVAVLVSGLKFAVGAWRQARAGRWGMDALVTLGAGTAYFYSVFGWFYQVKGHLYFMESASILAFISLGHWLEARVSARAETALKSLLQLTPSRAFRVMGATEVEVDVAELVPGDRIRVRPGDRVPTDGIVEEGEGGCDESMLTGESLPVIKRPGDLVMGGTLDVDGRWLIRVKAVGADTALARIVAVVRRAQTSRAAIQNWTDQITQVFVPAIVGVALLTALLWIFWSSGMEQVHRWAASWLWSMPLGGTPMANAVMAGAAVLIVACPCAMGLATPAAIMAAANAAARRGMLIRDGEALEKAGAVTLVAFDKTGTLTAGKPEVVEFLRNEELGLERWTDVSQLRVWASGLAFSSRHPVSRSISGGKGGDEKWADWRELRGQGIEARRQDSADWVRLGSVEWMKDLGVRLPADWIRDAAAESGLIRVILGIGQEAVGSFLLRDRPRPGAAELVEHLRKTGMKVRLITGDRREVGLRVGSELGFKEAEILSEVRPEKKAAAIEAWQKEGQKVAFVGDGMNDGPALSQADLGIAVTEASDVARETADVLLLRAGMEGVPDALEISRKTLRVIRQNLFWAFAYNVAAVPLAAVGLMHPILCAVAMGASDLIVLGNALRLLHIRSSGLKVNKT